MGDRVIKYMDNIRTTVQHNVTVMDRGKRSINR